MPASPSDLRADDILALARLSTRPGAVRAMLGWLTRRTGGPAVLVGDTGRVLAGPEGERDPAVARATADAVAELRRRGAPSAVLGGAEGRPVHLIALDTDPRTYLAVVGPDDPHCGTLLADAARTLALCWRLEQAERARRRIESAEGHSREAVLHLLMVGSVPAAQRIAGALRPALPGVIQVYVIECPQPRRREIARRIDREAGGGAWIVPCPVRPNHVIALVPPETGPPGGTGPADATDPATGTEASTGTDASTVTGPAPTTAPTDGTHPADATHPAAGSHPATETHPATGTHPADGTAPTTPATPAAVRAPADGTAPATPAAVGGGPPRPPHVSLDRLIVRLVPESRVGVSERVALRDTPTAYEQAIHALAVARNAPERRAAFGGDLDVTVLAGPAGYRWASELLAPCLRYAPARRADPGPQELLGTLGSWLSFGGAASRHLKIHRNTLAARVRHLDELLGVPVSRSLAAQSAAWLALRLYTAPQAAAALAQAPPEPAVTLEAVLGTPAAGTWARAQLRPLEQAGPATGLETVRTWLRADARLPAAAAALGISLPGARKRLTRAEDALGRSLLTAPSAKYELWLAMRALGSL
ncbi:helix-turn-helix domain-containing protein [Streptomyces hygroscopicus]|uniref:helix-turn-helix domain-containing protein n=1 Tax=Streptomyces TaxID=1883 RepID=UPI00209CBDA0|nr:helix-turn-helix domain-containing protein [Streptomyces sp. RKCA744]MCO8307495.1 helix-turn-helix domain-containing protein [Streptomyces sp. RKCA744]